MKPKTIMDTGIIYDEASCADHSDLQCSGVSEGADAKDIFNMVDRELPPARLKKPAQLTEAQKLSKLGASSAKIK